jgi:HSP20 family protein
MQPFGRSIDPFSFSPGEFFANPFGMMRRMHDEMDRMFAENFGSGGSQTGSRSGGGVSSWAPALEISQRGNNMVVSAELPGLRPEDVHLEVTDDALIVSGERQRSHESEEGGIHRTERHYGHFYRAVPLPEGINPEQVHAQFTDGVLEVTIPVSQAESRRRQIPIHGGTGKQQSSQPAAQTAATAGQSSGGTAQKAGTASQSSTGNR